jgi:putative holliday junction resolvase
MNSSADTVGVHLQSFLGFDFGIKRTGVAVGNKFLRTAQGLNTIKAEGDARWPLIQARIKEWQPDAIVIGVPYYQDGTPHDNTRRAQKFGRQLHARFAIPVFEVDERYSTTEALELGAKDADAGAACIILEGACLDQNNNCTRHTKPKFKFKFKYKYKSAHNAKRNRSDFPHFRCRGYVHRFATPHSAHLHPGDEVGGHHLWRCMAGATFAGGFKTGW